MNYFLGTNRYQWYGFGVVRDIVSGTPWERSGYFPRAAVCDFEVRQVANIQRYSVQCVLVINIFNEKIFVLLWFWYLILLFASTVSFIQWFVVLVFPCFSKWFIKQHLALSTLQNFRHQNSRRKDADVAKFVTQYLHKDGVFVLRMVSSHAGIIFATDLVQALYEAYDFQDKNKGIQGGSTVSDDLQTISTGAGSSIRHRKHKKGSRIEYKIGDTPFTTSLMPEKDEDESSSTSSSEEERKRVSNGITNI
uniref:Innexin n=1 Tax=Caenorhabditis tropicalis TaxID=1561998 RepID=A0A1I7SYM8_9PELO